MIEQYGLGDGGIIESDYLEIMQVKQFLLSENILQMLFR
jgi:hypothetical protein